jgi:hypothetical protein
MNFLQFETSPYLLQHKNNPVDWYPWSDKALDIAKEKNKLLIISVGYAACHWCHVMEHESFEDNEVADLMNFYYVSIKVDREERPDIDQIYMNAAMLTTGQGGWPLNIIALPNGKPIFAGTYFPKQKWMQVLLYFADLYKKEPEKLTHQAEQITKGLHSVEHISLNEKEHILEISIEDNIWENWKDKIDVDWGGRMGAPKFAMPSNYAYLLRYYKRTQNINVGSYIKTTLKRMAFGGIHDIIGGGFARYSVDAYWKVPHFEKMLYDNAQLMSIYSQAYQLTKRPLYKNVVEKMANWYNKEMTASSGGLYSSLDADSEGIEGKFYCWTYDELVTILGEDASFFFDVYNIEKGGNFEHDLNVLFRTKDHEYFMEKYQISNEVFQQKLNTIHSILLEKRNLKIRPATDDKILTEWNALAIKGLCDAYKAFSQKHYLEKAENITHFILKNCKKEDYRLDRNYKNNTSSINGFLPDYAFFIEALILMYQITLNEFYLQEALHFNEYVMAHFYNQENGMFYITSDIDTKLITRCIDSSDNVIPAANSAMAKSLLLLGKYFDNVEYEKISWTMLNNVLNEAQKNPAFYSNWAIVLDMHLHLNTELVVMGENALESLKQIQTNYLPNVLIAGSTKESKMPLTEGRYISNKTLFYVCHNKTCELPETDFHNILQKFG